MKNMLSFPSIVGTAVVTGLFSAVVSGVLVYNFLTVGAQIPLEEPHYLALKRQLEQQQGDPAVVAELRRRDLEVRRDFFRRQRLSRTGAFLLAGGLSVTVLLCQWAAALRRPLPPVPSPGNEEPVPQQNRRAQWASAGLILTVLLVAGGPQFISPSVLSANRGGPSGEPATPAEPKSIALQSSQGQQAASVRLPTVEEFASNWPQFRGPYGQGISAFTDVPQEWDGSTGEGIKWKTAVGLAGVSSPIVWEDRVFLTGATRDQREVYCVDAETGALLWRRPVDPGSSPELKINSWTGYAAPTPTTDGQRVYAIFANGAVAAFDFAGNEVWACQLGVPDNPYGHAASLVMSSGLLIIQYDQGSPDDLKSKLIALHGATGEPAWQVDRPVPASWSTPIVVEFQNHSRIITCADPSVIAYSADTGKTLWRADCLQGDVGPSSIQSEGVVYVANDYAVVAAVRDGGEGDVTESHILWTAEQSLPDICSPLVAGKFLLLATSYGALACYDRDGSGGGPVWELDLGPMLASPSLVGGRVFLFGDDGTGWVVKPTAEGGEILAENNLGERCSASPAFGPGRIYVRGERHLFCISQ